MSPVEPAVTAPGRIGSVTLPAIRLEQVAKTYGEGAVRVQALHPTDLEIGTGEFVVILGPSGSGKTTLVNLIAGIDTPSSGRLMIAGEDISHLSADGLCDYRRRRVGVVFQFYNLIPTLTALENVELVAELVPRPMDPMKVIEDVGLGPRAHHFPSELSGGEQQRVAIARALVKEPSILLGDEPTGNLDYETGTRVLKLLKRINQERKITVLMVTHNVAFAPVADRVIELVSGKVKMVRQNPEPVDPDAITW